MYFKQCNKRIYRLLLYFCKSKYFSLEFKIKVKQNRNQLWTQDVTGKATIPVQGHITDIPYIE